MHAATVMNVPLAIERILTRAERWTSAVRSRRAYDQGAKP